MLARRTFLQGGAAALATTASVLTPRLSHAQQVPNSVGTEPPKLKAPANACDCHMHVYDPRFREYVQRPAPSHATVSDYRLLQKRIGTTRVVVVTPRNYAVDNRVTVDALGRLGANARAVAVVDTKITDAELKALNDAGVRGIRFSVADIANAVVSMDMTEPLSKRIADLGWHVQFYFGNEQIVEHADLLRRLPSQIVIDHLGHPPLPAGLDHPSHAIVRGLIDKGRTWVKLSNPYGNSTVGPPSYPEATRIAQALVKAAPERMVWGSDWPHPGLPDNNKPNDAILFDLLSEWAPDQAIRNRILVQNPETLYGFPKSA